MTTATLDTDTAATEPLTDSRSVKLLRSTRNWLRAFVVSWFIVLAISAVTAVQIGRAADKTNSDVNRAECLTRHTGEFAYLCD